MMSFYRVTARGLKIYKVDMVVEADTKEDATTVVTHRFWDEAQEAYRGEVRDIVVKVAR